MAESVIVRIQGRMAILELNEPERLNAISVSMRESLLKALDEVNEDNSVHAILLCGNGKAFCSGGDISNMQNSSIEEVKKMDRVSNIVLKMISIKKPIVTAVHGYAMGGGFSLAMASDVVFADEDVKFGLSYKNIGLSPDIGMTYILPRIVGVWKAKEWIYTGRILSASEAKQEGFVNDVITDGKVKDEAIKFTEMLAEGPSLAYEFTKEIINRNYFSGLSETIAFENSAQVILKQSDDAMEGINAFREKRSPKFLGK